VLSAVITRIRGSNGAVPVVVSFDDNEKLWNPQMPLLFQRRLRAEDRPVSAQAVRQLFGITVDQSGLTDASGQPLRFAPHDFRRLLITDAIMHGMPPHIAQLIAGHRDRPVRGTGRCLTPICRWCRPRFGPWGAQSWLLLCRLAGDPGVIGGPAIGRDEGTPSCESD
jgi:hypothetical protein